MMLMYANKFKIQKSDVARIQFQDEELQADGSLVINSVSGAVMTLDNVRQLRDLLIQLFPMDGSNPEVPVSH